jgi:glutathione S-transferase
MIELYEFAPSGNSHKVRLFLSLLGLKYHSVMVDGAAREHKSAAFLAMNPFGQVPVLKDGDVVLRDSQAILIYLARRYGDANWLPTAPAAEAQVMAWLFTAANEVARGPSALRLQRKFGRDINEIEAQRITAELLTILEKHLGERDWLATEHATIADIAMYPYIALAPEGGVNLTPFPAITRWLGSIQALPGYLGMTGMQTF